MAEATWNLENLKQTLEYLKNAVKSEREERKLLKTNLEKLSNQVSETENELKEKVSLTQIHSISILNLVTQDLDHKVRKIQLLENCSSSSPEDRMTDSRSLFILEQNNSKLTEKNQSLESENTDLLSKTFFLEKEIQKNLLALSTSDTKLKDHIEDLKSQISSIQSKISAELNEKSEIHTSLLKVKEDSLEIDQKLREKNGVVTCLEEKHSVLKKELESSKEYEKEIVEKLANHFQRENEMASELLKYRSTVAEARSSYQKFHVKRIWMLSTSNVTLILRKGEDGKHVLQTVDGKKEKCLKISEVDAVFMHPTRLNRFVLRTSGEQDQEYESENAVKIMGLIRELIFSDFNGR